MARTLRIAAVLAAALLPGGAIAWTGLNLPPPRLLLKYGLPSSQRPTGRVAVIEGVEFHEIGPGCYYQRPLPVFLDPSVSIYYQWSPPPPALAPLRRAMGLDPFPAPFPRPAGEADGWVEIRERFWATRDSLAALAGAAGDRGELAEHARSLLSRLEETGLPIEPIRGDRAMLALTLLPPATAFVLGPTHEEQNRERLLRNRLEVRLPPSEAHRIDPWLRRR